MKRTALTVLAVVAMSLPIAPAAAHASEPGSCGVGAWLMDEASAFRHAEVHGFDVGGLSEHFAHLDRNGSGFLCASYAPTSSPRGPLGFLNITDDNGDSGVVSFRFTKSDGDGDLAFTGTYDAVGPDREMSSVVEVLGQTPNAYRIRVTWTFGDTVVVQTGTLSTKDGDVQLRGAVTEGPYAGRGAVDTGHVGPGGAYLGVMSILPG